MPSKNTASMFYNNIDHSEIDWGSGGVDFVKNKDKNSLFTELPDKVNLNSVDGDAYVPFPGDNSAQNVNELNDYNAPNHFYGGDDRIQLPASKQPALKAGFDLVEDERFGEGYSWEGDRFVHGHQGDDIIQGHNFADFVSGGDGNDQIKGGNNNDCLHGDAGDDIVLGDNGDDFIMGGTGSDILLGGNDDDEIHGGQYTWVDGKPTPSGLEDSDDELYGGNGNDLLTGDGGNDFLAGGNDDDILFGGEGNDELRGGHGDDMLFGDGGDDLIRGGQGDDIMTGGDGTNTFAFGHNSGADLITDLGSDDVLDFSDLGAFDVLAAASAAGDDLVITLGANNSLTIAGALTAASVEEAVADLNIVFA